MSIPLLFSKRAFHPRQLFSAMQGAWLEPIVGNIWQENTGVTPTTTGGQTIGRIADLSGYGNVATQATAANRPVLGRRYNLLTYSENFSNGAWVKANCSITSVTATAPDGTPTATTIAFNSTSFAEIYQGAGAVLLAGVARLGVYTIWIRRRSGTGQVRLKTPTGTGYTNINPTSNWQLFTSSTTNPFTSPVEYYPGVNLNEIGGQLDIWHPYFKFADVVNAPDYQRITTATDYDYGQYPAAIHDTNDSLVVSLPNLGEGIFSASGSVYFATLQGMSALHGQSMGTTYTLPALSTDIYSWMVLPKRLSTAQETRLERYMLRKAGIAVPDYLTDDLGEILTDDIGDPLLAG